MTKPAPLETLRKNTRSQDVVVGEIWAYREATRASDQKVTVVGLHDTKKSRVLVRKTSGEVLTVPAQRLRSLWADRGSYRAGEERWAEFNAYGPPSEAHRRAVGEVLDNIESMTGASVIWDPRYGHGCLSIGDMRLLTEATGLEASEIIRQPSFIDGDELYVPWESTEIVARAVAKNMADRTSRQLAAMRETLSNEYLRSLQSDEGLDELRKVSMIVTDWAGAAIDVHDENTKLRARIAELESDMRHVKAVADEAIGILRKSKPQTSDRLAREIARRLRND